MANDVDRNFKSLAADVKKTKEDLSNIKSNKPAT